MQRSGGIGPAQAKLDEALDRFTHLELEFQRELETLESTRRPEALVVQPVELTPRKADITVEQVVLAWTPWQTTAGATPEAAY
jgi:hypothetical protein